MTRFPGPAGALILLGLGSSIGFLVLETGARVVAVREERREGRLERDLAHAKGPGPGATVTLGQMIRKSANPRIVYELRPRLDVRFAGGRVTTSDQGYRGAEVASPKTIATYRIVGIGDSYMFGQGVSDEETYLARLTGPGVELMSGRRVETVNLAVPGYNTVMEVESLRERVAGLEPDLIVIEVVGNDLDLPNFLWSEIDPWSLRRSFLLEFVRERAGVRRVGSNAAGLSEAPLEGEGTAETFSRDASKVDPRYASMVGLPAFEQAIRDLAKISNERGVPVVAITHGVWFEEEMLKTLGESRIPVLVLRSALRQRARALGAPDYARSPLAQSPRDLHPSALGHAAIAEELAAWLRERR